MTERPLTENHSSPEKSAHEFVENLTQLRETNDFKTTQVLLANIGSLLDSDPFITTSFKEHLKPMIEELKVTSLLEHSGYGLILTEVGIKLDKKKWGIFNPTEAAEIEKKVIDTYSSNPYLLPKLAKSHSQKMDAWVREYQEKQGKK